MAVYSYFMSDFAEPPTLTLYQNLSFCWRASSMLAALQHFVVGGHYTVM
jgi:hypothetical protein